RAPAAGPQPTATLASPGDDRCRAIAALAPAGGYQVAEANAPQVRALVYLLRRERPAHLLLWVEEGVPLLDLLGQVDEQLGEEQTLFVVDLAALGSEAGDAPQFAREVAALSAGYRSQGGACLVVDLTSVEGEAARAAVECLQGSLAQPAPRLVLALPAAPAGADGSGPDGERADQALLPARDAHAVWLHQLPASRSLERI
ncbi:MAG: hypothetical protein QME94_09130, partial [Anaerolineae bacterium]|nr:hypothetical protein [Anaerolineae bacterium]